MRARSYERRLLAASISRAGAGAHHERAPLMARLLCEPCADKGLMREAENASDVWVYGATPKCGSCIDLPADDGGGSIRESASERTDAEQRAKGER